MELTNEKISILKKTLLTTALLLITVSLTIFLESQLNKFHIEDPIQTLQVNGDSSNLGVSFSPNADGSDLVKFSTNPNQLPTYLRANSDLTLIAFEDTFLTMSEGAEFRTLIFTKKKLHLQLIKGEVILDNRLSHNPVTIQVDNIMLKPYEKGVFYFDKDNSSTVQALNGQALVGLYTAKGKLQHTILLPRSTRFSYQGVASTKIKPEPVDSKPDFYLVAKNADILPNIQQEIEAKELLNLQYKSRNIDPVNSTSFLPDLTQALTFNNKKRNYLKLYSFAEQLKFAEASLLASNLSQGTLSITEAKRTFQDQTASSPNSLNTFKDFLQETYSYYIGLSPDQNLNNIKVYITDTHLNLLDDSYLKLAILSYFEDIDVYYSKGRTSEAESTLDKVAQLTTKADLSIEDSTYMTQMLDNLLAQYSRSNTVQAFILRTSLAEDIKDTNEFEQASAKHLQRLQTYFQNQEIGNNNIQESVAILINQVSPFEKLQYEDFFDEVSKAAL